MYKILNRTRECLLVEGKDLLPGKSIAVQSLTHTTNILASNNSISITKEADKVQVKNEAPIQVTKPKPGRDKSR